MNQLNRIYVHFGGLEEVYIHELNESTAVETVILGLVGTGKLGAISASEIFLFEEDSDEELLGTSILSPELRGKRFHAHRCHEIKVKFIYVDDRRDATFRSGATIGKLLNWAKEHFPIDKSGRYALRLDSNGDPLPHAAHIGSFVKGPPCELTLYFTPIVRIQG